MINAALNLVPMAVGQGRPQIIPAVIAPVTPTTPLPATFSDPLYVTSPTNTDSAWRVDDWPIEHGGTLPTAGAACALYYDSGGALRCVWWDGVYTAPSPGGTAGGDLSGTYPNPTVAKVNGTTVPLTGSAWITASLVNSWTAVEGGAVYMKDPMGFVHMRGALESGTSNTVAFTVPVGYRPGVATYYASVGDGGAAGNYVFVNTDGTVVPTRSGTAVRLNNVIFLAEN